MDTGESFSALSSTFLMLVHLAVGSSCFTVLSAVVLWAVISRRNGPLRAGVWLAALLLLTATGAGEVTLFYILFSACLAAFVILTQGLSRSLGGRFLPPSLAPRQSLRYRFQVVDLLWATGFCGVVFAAVASVLRQPVEFLWARSLLASTAAALAATASTGFVFRRSARTERLRLLWAIRALLTIGGCAVLWAVADPWELRRGKGTWSALMAIAPVVMLLWMTVVRRCGWLAEPGCQSSALQTLGKWGVGGMVVLAAVPTLVVYWKMVQPLPSVGRVSPDRNGYRDLVEATRPLRSQDVPYAHIATPAVLRDFARSWAQRLQQARVILARPLQIPIGYSRPAKYARHRQLSRFTLLAQAFDAEAKIALLDGDPDLAAQRALDCIFLGFRTARGGLTSDWYYGRAMERIGLDRLRSCRQNLTAERCRMLARRMSQWDAERESFESAIARNAIWRQYTDGWRGRYEAAASQLAGLQRWQIPIEVANWNDSLFRLLIIDLSIRAFALESDRLPDRLDQLVPDFLSHLPPDPCSGGRLVYRVRAGGYDLYGVGLDGRDDGGEPVPLRGMYGGRGDLFLDFSESP